MLSSHNPMLPWTAGPGSAKQWWEADPNNMLAPMQSEYRRQHWSDRGQPSWSSTPLTIAKLPKSTARPKRGRYEVTYVELLHGYLTVAKRVNKPVAKTTEPDLPPYVTDEVDTEEAKLMVTVGRRQLVWKPRPRKTRFSKRGQIGCVLKENALQKWEVIIEMAEPVHSSLLQLLAECKTEQEVRDMIENAFRGNWGTCNKRAGSFAMFVRWCRTTQIKPFPLTVHKVCQYVEMLRQENASATRAHSFLGAGRYATVHLGLIKLPHYL